MPKSDREKLLETLAKINVQRIEPKVVKVSTGIPSMDTVLKGGLPLNRATQIYGAYGGGKSTLSLFLARQRVREGQRVLFCDTEATFDPDYALSCGLDTHEIGDDGQPMVDVVTTEVAEGWLEAVRAALAARVYGLIVVDTVAGMAPRSEYEADIEKAGMGVFPRLLSKFFRIVTPVLRKSDCALLLLNQQRLDIGNAGPYGAPKIAPGGNALDHNLSINLEIMTPEDKVIPSTGEVTGLVIRYRIKKTKLFTPTLKMEHRVPIVIDGDVRDIDYAGEAFSLGVKLGVFTGKDGAALKKGDSFYYFEGRLLGHGQTAVETALVDDPELFARVMEAIHGVGASQGDPGDVQDGNARAGRGGDPWDDTGADEGSAPDAVPDGAAGGLSGYDE